EYEDAVSTFYNIEPDRLKDKVESWFYAFKTRFIHSWFEMTDEFFQNFFLDNKSISKGDVNFKHQNDS
ncbi:hypothetical protein DVH24_019820, partial [Malus domestica]